MKKSFVIPLFIFLFFIIFSIQVHAYTMFSANPYINDSISNEPLGYVLYNSIYNNSFYYNATCSGFEKCIIIENNGTGQFNKLYLQQYDWFVYGYDNQWSDYTALLTFDEINAQYDVDYIKIHLPKNQEGILIMNYRWNNTLTTPIPKLLIDDMTSGTTVTTINLNTTINNWYNISYIFNSTTSDRDLRIHIDWYWDNNANRIEIDKWKLYTFDINEGRTDWSTNQTAEFIRYCDVGTLQNYDLTNSTKAWLIGITDSLWCGAFKLGNLTIARHFYFEQNPQCSPGVLYRNDMFFWLSAGTGSTNCGGTPANLQGAVLFESLTLTTAKITPFDLCDGTAENYCENLATYCNANIMYDGSPVARFCMCNVTHQYMYDIRKSISLIDGNIAITTYTPGGSNWIATTMSYPGACDPLDFYHPFFTSLISCEPTWTCSGSTNYETFTNSSCGISQNNYCGECGCDAEGERCDIPTTTGAWCDDYNLTLACTYTNNVTPCYDVYTEQPNPYNSSKNKYTVYLSDCSSTIQDECEPNFMCVQYFNPLTKQYEGKVQCYNGQNGSAYYFNETGDIFDGRSYTESLTECIDASTYTNYMTCTNAGCNWCNNICQAIECEPEIRPTTTDSSNMFNWLAMGWGSLFGMSDAGYLAINQTTFAILFSFIFAILVTVGLMTKLEIEGVEKIFMLTFLGWFAIFTVAFSNLILWGLFVIFIVLSAGIMTGFFKKTITGGG